MVLEYLINPIKAEKKPWMMFFVGLAYSSVAVILSLLIFREYASLVMVFLTVLASVPIVYGAIKMEEKKDLVIEEERILIKEHGKALSFFMFLFVGFLVSFMLWYAFLPTDMTSLLFNVQIGEINKVNELNYNATGHAINLFSTLGSIFLNNIWVMLFSLLFSFVYGVGGIFILTWNASVIAAAVGMFVRSSADSYFLSVPYGLLKYSLHGIPEMLAYFMAGLAGGIISVAIIRHDFGTPKFKHILMDSIDLIVLAIVVLFAAALMEVFMTPMLF